MLNDQTSKTCQMIDSTLLDIRGDSEHRLEPKSESKKVQIYIEGDKQVICIKADLHLTNKS